MANASFGVNIIPKNNTVTIGNSNSPWTIVSPSLTGTPTAPTAASGTNTMQVATTAFVQDAKDVREYLDYSDFPLTGAAGILYVDKTTNSMYRWGGSSYVQVGGGSPVAITNNEIDALFETSSGGDD